MPGGPKLVCQAMNQQHFLQGMLLIRPQRRRGRRRPASTPPRNTTIAPVDPFGRVGRRRGVIQRVTRMHHNVLAAFVMTRAGAGHSCRLFEEAGGWKTLWRLRFWVIGSLGWRYCTEMAWLSGIEARHHPRRRQ